MNSLPYGHNALQTVLPVITEELHTRLTRFFANKNVHGQLKIDSISPLTVI